MQALVTGTILDVLEMPYELDNGKRGISFRCVVYAAGSGEACKISIPASQAEYYRNHVGSVQNFRVNVFGDKVRFVKAD